MKKKRIIFTTSIVGILLIIIFCMMISSINNNYDYENNSKMFEKIEDLNFLDQYVVEENIELDKHAIKVGKENIIGNKTVSIEYNGDKISIFAYVFSNSVYCLEYASEVSGNDYANFYDSDSITKYCYRYKSFLNIFPSEELLVFSREKAYVISAKISEKDFNDFIEYFINQLPIELEMTYWLIIWSGEVNNIGDRYEEIDNTCYNK